MRLIPNHPLCNTFEWDDEKGQKVLMQRHISFADAVTIFKTDHRFTYVSAHSGTDDARFITVGLLKNKPYAVVYTIRESAIRIITIRRAHKKEVRYDSALFIGRN